VSFSVDPDFFETVGDLVTDEKTVSLEEDALERFMRHRFRERLSVTQTAELMAISMEDAEQLEYRAVRVGRPNLRGARAEGS
jgi:hypothetical protein